jgi:hypothetical protein
MRHDALEHSLAVPEGQDDAVQDDLDAAEVARSKWEDTGLLFANRARGRDQCYVSGYGG